MIKIIKNKKGFTANFITLLICFIIFAFVGFVFYILFSLIGGASVYDIKGEAESLGYSYSMANFLKRPVDVDGKRVNMADLIVIWNKEFTNAKTGEMITEYRKKEKNKYTDQLENEVKKFLSESENPCLIFYPVYFEAVGGRGYSYAPYLIQSPKFDVGCYHNPTSSIVVLEIPSFNPPEGRELNASSIKVALERKLTKND